MWPLKKGQAEQALLSTVVRLWKTLVIVKSRSGENVDFALVCELKMVAKYLLSEGVICTEANYASISGVNTPPLN
jgi:hypothetical protein